MPKYQDVVPALRWRARQLEEPVTITSLVKALSVEGFPKGRVPPQILTSVQAFRKFNQGQREHAADQYIRSLRRV